MTPQNLSANPAVASAIQAQVASATGPAPQRFGEAILFIDPEPNGLIQYCRANITNRSGTLVVGVVAAALPTAPAVVIPDGTAAVVKTLAPIGCAITTVFTTGGRAWRLAMTAVTKTRNTVSGSPNVTVVPGDYNSAHWEASFTLNL